MPSDGRRECILITALEVGDLHRHFDEVMFAHCRPLQFIMDSGNGWRRLGDRRNGPRSGVIAAVCTAGIPARLGGPRPRGLVGTVIAMSSSNIESENRTRVAIRAYNATVRLGLMIGGTAIGRRCRMITESICAEDLDAVLARAEVDSDDLTDRWSLADTRRSASPVEACHPHRHQDDEGDEMHASGVTARPSGKRSAGR